MRLASPAPQMEDKFSFSHSSVYLQASQWPEQLPSSLLRLRYWRDYSQIVWQSLISK